MAPRPVVSGLQLVLGVSLFCCVALAQNGAPALPPAGASNATYANVRDDTDSSTTEAAKPQATSPPTTTTATTRTSCSLVSVQHVRDELQGHLLSGAKLIELRLTLQGYPPDYLQDHLKKVFKPTNWVRSTGRQGRSLLVLEDNYDFMSLFFLSIGVYEMNVTIKEKQRNCLRSLSGPDILLTIQRMLLNDFLPQDQDQGQSGGSLSLDEHVCHMTIKEVDGYAEFRYKCCHLGPDDNIICNEITTDEWIDVLMAFIVITKVLVVLFSPSFLPGSLYRLKYVATEYMYRVPDDSPVKKLRMVVTQFPSSYGNDSKVVKLSEVKGMEYFKTMVDNMQLDKIYQVTFDRIRLSVKSRRLLGETHVPVGLLRVLYNNLVRCRIRNLAPLEECCKTNLLGRLNPGISCPNWLSVCKVLARMILLFLLVLPWILRIWVFFNFENDTVAAKKQAADAAELKTSFRGSLTVYLSPLHGFFVLIYIFLVVDSVVYGLLSKRMKENFKVVLRKCLRDMRERSRIDVCAWTTWVLVIPFRVFGVVGLLLFLPYLIIVIPVLLPVAAFYLFPALNLTVRLIIHFFLFLCPAKIMEKWDRFAHRFSKVRKQLDLNKVTAEESFDRGHKLTRRELVIQIVVILMVLVSFWSLTFLLMEVVSFLVEMAVYTLMGIIVNAGSLLQYITVIFMVVMYGRTSFNDVHNTFLTYHKKIHTLLLEMKRQKIDDIARQDAMDQENTALRVQGDKAQPARDPDIRLIVKAGKPLWRASSLLMFLDRLDTPFTPEKFFYDVITLNYSGAPGHLYMHFLSAFWSFFRILLFLFFVFVVVMAFGDAYNVSTTNQLLATVAGGFIPFLFRFIFSTAGGVPSLYTDSVQFRTQLDTAINTYMQNWPIYDIIPIEFGEANLRNSVILNSTSVMEPLLPANNNGVEGKEEEEDGEGKAEDAVVDVEVEEDDGGLDMIVDVSTAETRRRGPLGLREAGSASMLPLDSFSSRSTTRIYRPSPRESAIDV